MATERVTSRTGFAFLLQEMSLNTAYAAIPAAASTFDDAESAANVMATLKVSLSAYDNEELRAISTHSTFSLHDLKLGQQDVFVCAPAGAVNGELSGWFRMLTVLGLGIFEYIPSDLSPKCFFAIDELPALGNIEKLDKGPGLLRDYGVQLLGISQTIQALKDSYPQTWTTWVGNADAVYWMGTNDNETAEYLSDSLGRGTHSDEERPVLSAEQLKRYLDPDRGTMIVTRFGKRALKVKTAPYYKELPVKYYDADAGHTEITGRSETRGQHKNKTINHTTISDATRLISDIVAQTSTKPEIAYEDAKEIFGISEPFSLSELNSRRAMLDQRGKSNTRYLKIVNDAHDLLRETAKS